MPAITSRTSFLSSGLLVPGLLVHGLLVPGLLGLALFACSGSSSAGNTDAGDLLCTVGALGCPCTGGGGCDPGLVCGDDTDHCEAPPECACDADELCTRSCACDTDCEAPVENCLVKKYDAYSSAGGRNCGSDGNYTAECLAGDICFDAGTATCQVVHSGLDDISCPGRPYDAYSSAGGANCGSDGNYTAECEPGDNCLDSGTQCEVIGSAGGALACDSQTYAAFSGAGGRNCGSDGNYTAECFAGDVCEDASVGRCRYVHSPIGDNCPELPYDAYSSAGGPNCGSDGNYTAECKPADRCTDSETGECTVIGSSGGAIACGTQTYAAFSSAGGRDCGSDGNYTAECFAGDVCEDSSTGRCRFVHSASGGDCPELPYDAYSSAGGPNCGSDGNYTAECEPGDSCIDETTGSCN